MRGCIAAWLSVINERLAGRRVGRFDSKTSFVLASWQRHEIEASDFA